MMKISSIIKHFINVFADKNEKKAPEVKAEASDATVKKTSNSAFQTLATIGKNIWKKHVPENVKTKAKKFVDKEAGKYIAKKAEEVAQDVGEVAQKHIDKLPKVSQKGVGSFFKFGQEIKSIFPQLKPLSDWCEKIIDKTSLKEVNEDKTSTFNQMSSAQKAATVFLGLGVLLKGFSRELKPLTKLCNWFAQEIYPDAKSEQTADQISAKKEKVDPATKLGLLAAAAGVITNYNSELQSFTSIFDLAASQSAKQAAKQPTHWKSKFLHEVMLEEDKKEKKV